PEWAQRASQYRVGVRLVNGVLTGWSTLCLPGKEAAPATLGPMARQAGTKRLLRAFEGWQKAKDPLARLKAAHRVVELARQFESATLREARRTGARWEDIGAVYGMSKQGAQQRFGRSARRSGGSKQA